MKNTTFLRAGDVAKELEVSEAYAYKLIKKLNLELNEKGYLTVPGRINRKYFCEKVCYGDYNESED